MQKQHLARQLIRQLILFIVCSVRQHRDFGSLRKVDAYHDHHQHINPQQQQQQNYNNSNSNMSIGNNPAVWIIDKCHELPPSLYGSLDCRFFASIHKCIRKDNF